MTFFLPCCALGLNLPKLSLIVFQVLQDLRQHHKSIIASGRFLSQEGLSILRHENSEAYSVVTYDDLYKSHRVGSSGWNGKHTLMSHEPIPLKAC
jgi:hypothetical protein